MGFLSIFAKIERCHLLNAAQQLCVHPARRINEYDTAAGANMALVLCFLLRLVLKDCIRQLFIGLNPFIHIFLALEIRPVSGNNTEVAFPVPL